MVKFVLSAKPRPVYGDDRLGKKSGPFPKISSRLNPPSSSKLDMMKEPFPAHDASRSIRSLVTNFLENGYPPARDVHTKFVAVLNINDTTYNLHLGIPTCQRIVSQAEHEIKEMSNEMKTINCGELIVPFTYSELSELRSVVRLIRRTTDRTTYARALPFPCTSGALRYHPRPPPFP